MVSHLKLVDKLRRVTRAVDNAMGKACSASQIDQFQKWRKELEDYRVKHHSTLCSNVLVPERALTMDVLVYSTVCLCEYIAKSKCTATGSHRLSLLGLNTIEAMRIPFPVMCDPQLMKPKEISLTFSFLFQWARSFDVVNSSGFKEMLCRLQARTAEFIAEHILGVGKLAEFHDVRVLWACALGKIKSSYIQLHSLTQPNPYNPCNPCNPCNALNPVEGIDVHRLRKWVKGVVSLWDGSRMREAIAKAMKRTDLRPDEVGRTLAFAGGNTLQRARGSLDVAETALHELDIAWVMERKEDELSSILLRVQDIVFLKLVANVLEADAGIDFMENTVILQSNRASYEVLNPREYYIQQSMFGWLLVHNGAILGRPDHLMTVFRQWYPLYFKKKNLDPLKLIN
jgi:hypothetical protein